MTEASSPHVFLLVGSAVRLGRCAPHGAVHVATDAAAAEALLRTASVTVVVVPPGQTGRRVLDRAAVLRPDACRVLYATEAEAATALVAVGSDGAEGVVLASWDDDLLTTAVARLLDRHRTNAGARDVLVHVREERAMLDLANQELARHLDERTRSLRLAQQVLEHLPLPVLGIDCDGAVVLVNDAAARLFPHVGPTPFGLPVDAVLPDEAVDAAAGAVLGDGDSVVECAIGDRPCTLHIRTLYDGPSPRGCLVAFEGAARLDAPRSYSTAARTPA